VQVKGSSTAPIAAAIGLIIATLAGLVSLRAGAAVAAIVQAELPADRLRVVHNPVAETFAQGPAPSAAERQGLLDKQVADGSTASSVAFVYKQALLLAVADPYHLMQGEVIRVLDYVGRFAHLAEVRSGATGADQGSLFLVKVCGDVPPLSLPRNLRDTDWETNELLDTSALATRLSQQLGGLEAGIAPSDLLLPDTARDQAYRSLLKRLHKHWGASSKRYFNRKQYTAGLDLCVGIRAIHYFLNGEQAYGAATAHAQSGNGELDFATSAQAKKASFSSCRWNIVNESAGGMALVQASSIPSQIRSGEIVGLRSEGSRQWNIAVVRWVKTDASNRLELGIQMVAPYATAVAVKSAAAGAASPLQGALLLPEIPLLKQASRLLAPRGSLQARREFLLECEGKLSSYLAGDQVEATVAFEQFEFTPA